MEAVVVEVYQGEAKVASEDISSPITAAEAKDALRDIKTAWVGKLTEANGSTVLAGRRELTPGAIYHLHLQEQPGLHEKDRSWIPPPSNVDKTLITTRANLLEALQKRDSAPPAYAITIDEAGYLAGQHIKGKEAQRQSYDAVSCLLSVFKDEFRDNKVATMVHSVTLLGVDSVRRLLHDVNRGVHQQHPEASSSASAMDVERSSHSDSSHTWTNTSPFSEHNLFELDSFSVEQIADLLTQYRMQYQQLYGFPLQLDVQPLAQLILERTGGFPGLVGLCCSEITSKVISNPRDWYQWCGTDLVRRVQQQRNYSLISNTVAYLLASGSWPRLHEVLHDLLLYNSSTAERTERRTIVEMLLSDGIAAVLRVRCPLLRDVMLAEARFGLDSCPAPPDLTTLDMAWVLREAFQRIDIHNIEAAAARTKSKPFSEYIWHGELFPLMKAIVYKAYPSLCYRVITEARALGSAQHHNKRIDLAMTDQKRLPAHGVEALICGSVECVREHYMRAASIYQPLYSQQSDDGTALPSTIQVVNICSKEQPGTGYGWQPEHDNGHVKMVHVMLCKDYSEAHVTWSDSMQEVLTVRSAAHGQLEFHIPQEL
ncbi:hypothetical protein COCSUDRAFT_59427 [Coccomyxa subellipsoidea C-169]|uniref:Uncharacterized protein n=1 Tax=Coccomyxa subellipsoidea (strain C-169) TaxID=574566 RepID=I0Z8F7_COCSC|nr:hypothetical protein COCSUDRAFT_59427 [Coccomyxa subellipsoidea C-169]EIE26926.1 hypothetical protein COCSUDRAFT_59427 [Coccomyxa subellipsoidea C-169]|eukprot:XP_005651470.1 hypothetical protein COCSUDRAFT_59427 [Coccomyxa subellipsoidea C-169]